jgi:TolB-like protein
VKADDDSHVWAQSFNRVLTERNLLTLQVELAHSIAEALQVKLKPSDAYTAIRHKNAQAH